MEVNNKEVYVKMNSLSGLMRTLFYYRDNECKFTSG